MFSHFLKITIRSFRKQPLLSLLNVSGLSIGLSAFLVIGLYIFQETSYEKRHDGYEDMFRLEEHFMSMGRLAWTSSNLQYKLDEIPEIEAVSRFNFSKNSTVQLDENHFIAERVIYANNDFFELFAFNFLSGINSEALSGPGQVVVTEKFAQLIFGHTDVLGKPLRIYEVDHLISGVVKTSTIKSNVDFDIAVYQSPEDDYANSEWFGIGGYTFVKALPGTSALQLNERLDNLVEQHVYKPLFKSDERTFDEWKESDNKIRFYARPIRDIYLNADVNFDIGEGGDRQTIVTLSIIGSFILLIASINFMNLTTARSSKRTKEIGMRKVLGSKKSSLIFQFLMESVMMTILSALIAAGLAEGFINVMNQQFGEIISVSLMSSPSLILYLFIGALLLGIVSGLYPAFYLTSTKVIPLLKGMQLSRVLNLNFAKGLRNGLVITQFTLSTGLIIGSIFIYNQLIHLKNKDLGFDKEQVIVIDNIDEIGESKAAFKNKLLTIAGVKNASYAFRMPGDGTDGISASTDAENKAISMSSFRADEDFVETLGLKMNSGEWFGEKHRGHDSLVVVNNAFVKQYGIEDPIGYVYGGNHYRIIGVVNDFNYGNMREAIGPAIFYSEVASGLGHLLALKVEIDQIPFDQIESAWYELTNEPFGYHFLGENFVKLLEKEKQTANAVLVFTILAILISCLGLFGLAAFTADQRLHEFGIRKVLGASINDIVKLFSFDFLKLIAIAFVISIPLAIWGVNQWLNGFADRISLSASVFIIAGALAMLIAFVTILFQSLKTGRLNPVDTIKNE